MALSGRNGPGDECLLVGVKQTQCGHAACSLADQPERGQASAQSRRKVFLRLPQMGPRALRHRRRVLALVLWRRLAILYLAARNIDHELGELCGIARALESLVCHVRNYRDDCGEGLGPVARAIIKGAHYLSFVELDPERTFALAQHDRRNAGSHACRGSSSSLSRVRHAPRTPSPGRRCPST